MSTTAEQSLTHHVRLIMDNDEGIYLTRREIIRDALEMDADTAPRNVADRLEELYAALVGLNDDFGVEAPGLAATEILSTALAFVDWYAMALDYIEEEGE